MRLKKTTNNVLGVVQLTPRKRTKKTVQGGTAGIFTDVNTTSYVYFRATHVPSDMNEESKKELELDNPKAIYFSKKENLLQNPKFNDADTKGQVIFVDPFCIMGIINEEDANLFEEFGGTEPIIEE